MSYPLALLHLHISNTRTDNTASAACSSQGCVCVCVRALSPSSRWTSLLAVQPPDGFRAASHGLCIQVHCASIIDTRKSRARVFLCARAHSVCVTGEALSAWLLLKINPGLMILTQAGCSLLALKDTSHRVPRAHTGRHMTGRGHSKVPCASRSRIGWFAQEIKLLPRVFFFKYAGMRKVKRGRTWLTAPSVTPGSCSKATRMNGHAHAKK